MIYLSQITFLLILAIAAFILTRRIQRIRSNILLGQPEDRSDRPAERWKTMLLIAFGQKKMFKRPVPAFFHFLIYAGFLIINLEVLEFILDGLLGSHRVFAPFLGDFYGVAINFFEFLALAVLVSCVVFLIRRNVLRVPRLNQRELQGWPVLDANLILIIEGVLMLAILSMNAADQLLQNRLPEAYPQTGTLWISSLLVPFFEGLPDGALVGIERSAWWFHIVGIFAFAIYVTYSKHLHIFMSFPNTYYSRLQPKGKFENMEVVTNEVKMMLGLPGADQTAPPAEVGRFGARDVTDLSWKNLMDAYSCTECGRCTAECPANITGKKLSPRKIMMDTRDRLEEYGFLLAKGEDPNADGRALFGSFISKEEINACTTCNACTEACPVNIDPLSIIMKLRQYQAMEESGSPASWNAMFSNIENNFAPWKFSPSDRFNWANELKNQS